VEVDNNGNIYTNAPSDIESIFREAFEVVRSKSIKELILKVLKVF
jgi:hypothetical protein